MGNVLSITGNNQVPKHLRPARVKRKKHDDSSSNMMVVQSPHHQVPREHADVVHHHHHHEKQEQAAKATLPARDLIIGDGPRGAFLWLQGRRYNYNAETNSLYPLPNDQKELDRLRVFYYLLRWAFGGLITAPVEPKLRKGIHVLNVGAGPGIWIGHPVIDMALDYSRSKFVTVDIADLLPYDLLPHIRHKLSPQASVVSEYLHQENNEQSQQRQQATSETTSSSSAFEVESGDRIGQPMGRNHDGFTPVHPAVQEMHEKQQQQQSSESAVDNTLKPPPPLSIDITTTPPTRRVFKNLDAYIMNTQEQPLPFPDNTFDFVTMQLVTTSFRRENWPSVILELVRVTKPGGYIQLLDVDYHIQPLGPIGQAWEDDILEKVETEMGLAPGISRHFKWILESLGLENVRDRRVSMPIGEWGLDIGILWQQNVEAFVEATRPLVSQGTHVTLEELKERWAKVMEELQVVKAFNNIHAAWARKPRGGDFEPNRAVFDHLPDLAPPCR